MRVRARLSLQVPAADRPRWEAAFDAGIAAFLGQRGFPEPAPAARPPVEGVCARAFSFIDTEVFARARRALEQDAAWPRLLADLAGPGRPPQWRLALSEAVGVVGKTVEAGSGQRLGDWLSFGVDDGLCSALVTGIRQDSRGRLWMLTYDDGVCSFDGQRFTTYTVRDGLPGNRILALLEDSAGRIWLGGEGAGVCRLEDGDLTLFGVEDGMPGLSVTSLCEDGDGRVWAVGPDGWPCRFDDERCKAPALDGRCPAPAWEPPDAVELAPNARLGLDGRGALWLVGPGAGLYRLEGAGFVQIDGTRAYNTNGPLAFVEDDRGLLWFGTQSGPVAWDGRRIVEGDVPGGRGARPVALDGRGRVYFDFEGAGAVRRSADGDWSPCGLAETAHLWGVDPQGGLWYSLGDRLARQGGEGRRVFGVEDGLAHGTIRSLCVSAGGGAWFGTWGGGICRYDGDRFTHYGAGGPRVESVFCDSRGRLWWGAWGEGGGLYCLEDGRLGRFGPEDGMLAGNIWCVLEDKRGRVWFGGQQGLSRYDGAFAHFGAEAGLAGASVWSLFEDSRGDLWVGTQDDGAYRRVGDAFEPLEAVPRGGIWDIAEDGDGGLWFSVDRQGVWRRGPDGGMARYGTADGLAHERVWCIYRAADGGMWFGTWAGGVSRWDGRSFRTYTTEDGLSNNHVRSITQDRDGRLWFCTFGGGACCFDGQVFQVLAKKDGLAHDSVQCVAESGAGDLWFATESGVTRYRRRRHEPGAHIRAVIADRRHEDAVEVEVPAPQQLVAFELGASSFATRPRRMVYVYRLVGAHGDWHTTYGQRVEYRDLDPGDYTFEVRAVDRDLTYSPPASVRLRVVRDRRLDRIEALEAELSRPQGLEEFVGASPALQRVLEQIKTVAETDVTVLIGGETGTGKGLAARAVHAMSERGQGPFIQLNCGAIPEGLVESELFGHEKGAFTGAVSRQLGRFERAAGGTLFLDEIGDLPLASQRVLLQVLQEGTFHRVGGRQTMRADVRLIAATNRDLAEAMAQGQFREDLFYRLSVFGLTLPPLRRRREDVPLLAHYFVERFARHLHRPVPRIDPAAMDYLRRYDWPGNVRELEHLIQRAVLLCRDGVVRLSDTAPPESEGPPEGGARQAFVPLDEFEREYVEKALRACNGMVYGERGAARLLGVHPERLRSKMRKWGLAGGRAYRTAEGGRA